MEWEPVTSAGYTRARKCRVRLDDGTYVFAKEAPATEVAVYESVHADFLPRVHEIRDGVLPTPEWAAPGTNLREDQQSDLAVALPWVAELLGRPLGERQRR